MPKEAYCHLRHVTDVQGILRETGIMNSLFSAAVHHGDTAAATAFLAMAEHSHVMLAQIQMWEKQYAIQLIENPGDVDEAVAREREAIAIVRNLEVIPHVKH